MSVLTGWLTKTWEALDIEINNDHKLIIYQNSNKTKKTEYDLSPTKCIVNVDYDVYKDGHELRVSGMIGEKQELYFRSSSREPQVIERELKTLQAALMKANN